MKNPNFLGMNFELTLAPPPWCFKGSNLCGLKLKFFFKIICKVFETVKLPHLIISPSTETVNGIPNLVPVLILKKLGSQFQTQFQKSKSDPVLVQFLLITATIGSSNMPKSSTWPTVVYTLPYITQHSALDPLPGPNLNESIEGLAMGPCTCKWWNKHNSFSNNLCKVALFKISVIKWNCNHHQLVLLQLGHEC